MTKPNDYYAKLNPTLKKHNRRQRAALKRTENKVNHIPLSVLQVLFKKQK